MRRNRSTGFIAVMCLLIFGLVHANENADIKVCLFDAENGSPVVLNIETPRAKHWADITCLSFHPHDKLLVSGGDDQTISVWNSDTLDPIDRVAFLPGLVHVVKFLGDRRIVVILHDATDEEEYMFSSSTVLILKPSDDDLTNCHWIEQSRLTGFMQHIQSVTVTPDAKRMFLDDGTHAIHVYSLQSENPVWIDTILFPGMILPGSRGFPRSEAFPLPPDIDHSPLLTLIGGQPSFRNGERPLALATTNDGATLLVLTDHKLRTYRVNELRKPVSEVAVSGQLIAAIASNAKYVLVGSNDGKLSVFEITDDGLLYDLPIVTQLDSREISSLAISGDGGFVAASSVKNATCSIASFSNGKITGEWTALDVSETNEQLGLASQPIHWLYELHNNTQENIPVAFTSSGNAIATVRSRRQIVILGLDGNAQATSAPENIPGDAISLWDAPDRSVRCLDDIDTLFVATEGGGAKVNTKSGAVTDFTESLRPALISSDGSKLWGIQRSDDGQLNPFMHDVKSGDVRKFDIDWLGIQQSRPMKISPDGNFLAQLNSDELQLDLFDATTGKQSSVPFPNKVSRLIQFDTSNRLWAMHLSRSKTNELQHNLVRIDLSSGLAAKVETLYQVVASNMEFDVFGQLEKIPELDQFCVSRNGDAVVYRERNGAYRILSDASALRSRGSVEPIRCISNDGEFFVTLCNVNLGLSCVAVVRTKTGETIQQWRFPGVITDLDLAVDERSIATANANGSLTILSVKDRADWPTLLSDEESAAKSTSEQRAAERSLQLLIDEFTPKSEAFEARLAASTTKDDQTQIECDEPYSSHILDLIKLAHQYPGTDVEYVALHQAIGTKRVTPPHVPGAPWRKKRDDWYYVSSEADRQLRNIAHVEFVKRFIDDSRTASVLQTVIEYWESKETARLIRGAWELSLRSHDESVKAAALLIYAKANMGEQRKFLSSGHLVTEPTEDQLRLARATLQKVVRDYGELEIPDVGKVAEQASALIAELDEAGK